jgi:hypothetical protein
VQDVLHHGTKNRERLSRGDLDRLVCGTRAGSVLSMWASAAPDRFAAYVRNPQGVNPKSQMEASPQYDDATMKALADYFQSFSEERKR